MHTCPRRAVRLKGRQCGTYHTARLWRSAPCDRAFRPRERSWERLASAGTARQHPEERLDVRVGPGVTVAVEVRSMPPAGCTAVPAQAREEALDIRIGAHVPIPVEVGCPAGRQRGR